MSDSNASLRSTRGAGHGNEQNRHGLQRLRYLLLFVVAVALVPTLSNTAMAKTDKDTWATVAPMRSPRDSIAVATGLDGRIYALGGTDWAQPNNTVISTVEAYDPRTNTWTGVAPMPTPRLQLAATTGRDGRIYALGGWRDFVPLTTVEAYNPQTDTWEALPPMTTARSGLAAATGRDGRIYAIGGDADGTVEIYDPDSGAWTSGAPMPTARGGFAAATGRDGRIYVMGGGSSPQSTVEAYDPRRNAWVALASMPTPRYGLAAAAGSDGRIYALGGFDHVFNAYKTVEAYDPRKNTWIAVAPMSTARGLLGATAGRDKRIYAVGGRDYRSGLGSFDTVEAYNPG